MKKLLLLLTTLWCLTTGAAPLELYTDGGTRRVTSGERLLSQRMQTLTNPLGNCQYLFLADLRMSGAESGDITVTATVKSAATTSSQPMTVMLCQGEECVSPVDNALSYTFAFDPAAGERQSLDLEYGNSAFPGVPADEAVPTVFVELEMTVGYANAPEEALHFTLVLSNDASQTAAVSTAAVAAPPFSIAGHLLTPHRAVDLYRTDGAYLGRHTTALRLRPGLYLVKADGEAARKVSIR